LLDFRHEFPDRRFEQAGSGSGPTRQELVSTDQLEDGPHTEG
jgi:hypothetical protein